MKSILLRLDRFAIQMPSRLTKMSRWLLNSFALVIIAVSVASGCSQGATNANAATGDAKNTPTVVSQTPTNVVASQAYDAGSYAPVDAKGLGIEIDGTLLILARVASGPVPQGEMPEQQALDKRALLDINGKVTEFKVQGKSVELSNPPPDPASQGNAPPKPGDLFHPDGDPDQRLEGQYAASFATKDFGVMKLQFPAPALLAAVRKANFQDGAATVGLRTVRPVIWMTQHQSAAIAKLH